MNEKEENTEKEKNQKIAKDPKKNTYKRKSNTKYANAEENDSRAKICT